MPHPLKPLNVPFPYPNFTLHVCAKFSHGEHRCASRCWCSPTRHTTTSYVAGNRLPVAMITSWYSLSQYCVLMYRTLWASWICIILYWHTQVYPVSNFMTMLIRWKSSWLYVAWISSLHRLWIFLPSHLTPASAELRQLCSKIGLLKHSSSLLACEVQPTSSK